MSELSTCDDCILFKRIVVKSVFPCGYGCLAAVFSMAFHHVNFSLSCICFIILKSAGFGYEKTLPSKISLPFFS